MKTFGFATLVAALSLPGAALAKGDSAAAIAAAGARAHVGTTNARRDWGGMRQGRWIGGYHAPGGWTAYRRPYRGFVVPSYWIAPGFHIGNYGRYGFGQPHAGTAWSRYYDDAVLIDGRGHVYDHVYNVDWRRYDGPYDARYGAEYPVDYRDGYEGEYRRGVAYGYDEDDEGEYRRRRDDGVGGAIIGGVVGGIAGNRIAGRGNRTEGTLIGAGVGALAGAAIDRAEDRGRDRDFRPYPYGADYDHGYVDDRVTEGHYRPAPPPRLPYHPVIGGHQTVYAQPGTTTTIIIQPAVTTTTTTTTHFVEEVAHAPRYRKAPVKRYKPKPKCVCR